VLKKALMQEATSQLAQSPTVKFAVLALKHQPGHSKHAASNGSAAEGDSALPQQCRPGSLALQNPAQASSWDGGHRHEGD